MVPSGAFRRLLAKAWNANAGSIVGWPEQRLAEPAAKLAVEIEWEEFPKGLRGDVDRYLQGLTKIRKSRTGQRIRPLKPSTIRTRRAELRAAARMAAKQGISIESLNTFSALLSPAVAERILDAYWQRNGENPKLFTIDLAGRFLAIAKETKCLNDSDCERLHEMQRNLEDLRPQGMTDKNIAFLRQVLTPGTWGRVVNLPFVLMTEARRLEHHAPVRAAVIAQIAVAIAILAVAPIRVKNLTTIELGKNLGKPDGPRSNYWLSFPDYDVKNRMKLEYPLESYLTKLIDEYIHDFRPTLLRGRNEECLFPGLRQGPKGEVAFSGQISKRIVKYTGIKMTAHQFRHAAGALILKRRPGEYELVRQILGHRNIQTTINCYIGLDSIHASEIFTRIVMDQLDGSPEANE